MFVDATTEVTAHLINSWLRMRRQKREEELATDEWQRLERAYMDHLQWRFRHPRKVLIQQAVYSVLLTILVIGLVVSGLVFSFLQLRAALELGDVSSLRTEIEVETAGRLSMSSSIVGAVVLVVSLAFFNLYLKHVFRIVHVTPPHISISDTDAASMWRRVKDRIGGQNIRLSTKTNEQELLDQLEELVARSDKGSNSDQRESED